MVQRLKRRINISSGTRDSGLCCWRHVVWYMFTDVSEERDTSISRYTSTLTMQAEHEHCKHVQVYTTSRNTESHLRRQYSSLTFFGFLGYDTVQSTFRAMYCLHLHVWKIKTGLSPVNQKKTVLEDYEIPFLLTYSYFVSTFWFWFGPWNCLTSNRFVINSWGHEGEGGKPGNCPLLDT
jgi:hypothetical protein